VTTTLKRNWAWMLKEKGETKTQKEEKKKDTVKINICPKNVHLLYR